MVKMRQIGEFLPVVRRANPRGRRIIIAAIILRRLKLKECGMFQHQTRRKNVLISNPSWLSQLVDTLERSSTPELRAVPCGEPVVAALKARLALPATACSRFSAERRAENRWSDFRRFR
jgi:hypothetical protein